MLWIKIGAVALVLALTFRAGCTVQRDRDAATIAGKDAALTNAANALRASGAAIREINAEAERRIAEAERLAGAAIDAGKVAEAARIQAMAESERFAADLDKAKKRRPACAELAASLIDLEAVCGVKVR